jgi:hypothetical protein
VEIQQDLYELKLLARAVLLLAVEDPKLPQYTWEYQTARMLIYPPNEEFKVLRDLWVILVLLPESEDGE